MAVCTLRKDSKQIEQTTGFGCVSLEHCCDLCRESERSCLLLAGVCSDCCSNNVTHLVAKSSCPTHSSQWSQAFPSWQVLLVDLRCHGESARLPTRPTGPHSVETAGGDVLRLLGRLKLFPEILIGEES